MDPNFPKLTDDLRPGLRLQTVWETSLTSWLSSVSPQEGRELLEQGKETFLRHLDELAWQVAIQVNQTDHTPDELAEALRSVMPDQEEELSPEEMDAADDHPLTKEERAQFQTWAEEAQAEAEAEEEAEQG